jgi:ABC-type branched-subunit amino acid transport system ATPase component
MSRLQGMNPRETQDGSFIVVCESLGITILLIEHQIRVVMVFEQITVLDLSQNHRGHTKNQRDRV